MANSKIYLNVCYAEKDEAKALGAKWDPTKKKWYVPAELDMASFSKWQIESGDSVSRVNKAKSGRSAKKAASGAITYAKDEGFIAYSGDLPPWDL